MKCYEASREIKHFVKKYLHKSTEFLVFICLNSGTQMNESLSPPPIITARKRR